MRNLRRVIVLIVSTAVTLGVVTSPASAAAGADLSISIVDSPDPAPLFGEITYTITVGNAGPQRDTASFSGSIAGARVTSATSTGGDCITADVPLAVPPATRVSCGAGLLLNGAASQVTVVVEPIMTGPLTFRAFVFGNATDPDPSNNSAAESTGIRTVPPM